MRKNNEILRWLIENFNYVDSVTMIDEKGIIVVKQRYNPRYSDEENAIHNKWCVGKKLLEVFPHLNHKESSLLQALNKGKVVHYEAQRVVNHEGRISVTNNITFPVITRGKIVGAIELSRDITNIENTLADKGRTLNNIGKIAGKDGQFTVDDIIGENPKMKELKDVIYKIADSPSSVMVYGETGTGKELVVSAIHNAGMRRDKPFIAINCAAIPENILEGLLFGSQKGAFTGAENKKGMFEEANGGTIYLDEINSMPIMLQAKLLRVLQEKAVTPLGASKPIKLDVRIISSTNKPLSEVISAGLMREDMLYRLNTISITIPPLRERLDDIDLLSNYFVEKYNEEFGKNVKGLSKDVLYFFLNRSWKGNVRELEHVIECAMNIVEDGEKIQLGHLPEYLTISNDMQERCQQQYVNDYPETASVSLTESIEAYEKKLILDALHKKNGRIVDAAKYLKIPRTSLQYKMDKYGIKRR